MAEQGFSSRWLEGTGDPACLMGDLGSQMGWCMLMVPSMLWAPRWASDHVLWLSLPSFLLLPLSSHTGKWGGNCSALGRKPAVPPITAGTY